MKKRPHLQITDHWLWFDHFRRELWRRQAAKRGKVKQRDAMRRLRARQVKRNGGRSEFIQRGYDGLREYWMIGYDGPRPQPGSWWPRMMEHAQRYGL